MNEQPTTSPPATVTLPYQCPGESMPVTAAVHLSRLATGWHACRECPQRRELGHLVTRLVRETSGYERPERSLFTRDGVRGLYCNELTRKSIAEIASAVALIFWEEHNPEDPLRPRVRPGEQTIDLSLRRQRRAFGLDEQIVPPPHLPTQEPRIVLGYDPRASSPDLAIGVAESLRKWGCHVLAAGMVSRPELDFAVQAHKAQGGVYITGGTSPVNWNGMDVVDDHGWSWTLDHDWERVAQMLPKGVARPVRVSGHLESIAVRQQYVDSLRFDWNGLRPLRLGVVSACSTAAWILPELAQASAVTLHLERTGQVMGGTLDPPDAIADSLYDWIQSAELDCGVVIGSDGRSCYLMDERGEILLPEHAVQLLQFGAFPEVTTDEVGRYWLRPGKSQCDALRTLARCLQSISRDDRPVSEWYQVRS